MTSSVKSTESKLSEDALELCRKFDKDGNGYLTKTEIREAVGDTMSNEEIDELLEKADTDHDGKVDYKGIWETPLIHVYMFVCLFF